MQPLVRSQKAIAQASLGGGLKLDKEHGSATGALHWPVTLLHWGVRRSDHAFR